MNYWTENLKWIQKNHSYLLPLEKEEATENCVFETSRSGFPVPLWLEDGKKSLHSLYHPEKEDLSFNPQQFQIVLGMGGLFHLRNLMKKQESFILIEPVRELFIALLKESDLGDLLRKRDVAIFLGSGTGEMNSFLRNNYNPYLQGFPQLLLHKTSCRIFSESYEPFIKELNRIMVDWSREIATQKEFCKLWFRNSLINLSLYKPMIQPKKGNKILILAAGPSLEEKISSPESLKAESDRAIMAVDSTLPFLRQKGIDPDYVFSLDSQLVSYHHYLKGISRDSELIRDISTHPYLDRIGTDRKTLTGNPNPLIGYLFPELCPLNTGLGNVTAVAVDYSIKMGFRHIEIWGADYSYPPGKSYCRGSYLVNHYLYNQNRYSTLEHRMYSFSTNQSIKDPENKYKRSSKKMIAYRHNLENWLNSQAGIVWKKEELGHYEISNQNSSVSAIAVNPDSLKNRIRHYFSELKNLEPKQNFQNLSVKEQQLIRTLFPLMSLFLAEKSWTESLKLAREWALSHSPLIK